MTRQAASPSADLKRVPGLYRRWELPEILKDQRAYRIENAGTHQDGTPLVAVFADAGAEHQVAQQKASPAPAEATAVPRGTVSRRPE